MTQADPRVWTVAEAKARLSEVLRLSEEEGPQRIGTRKCYVVVPEKCLAGAEWSVRPRIKGRRPSYAHAAWADGLLKIHLAGQIWKSRTEKKIKTGLSRSSTTEAAIWQATSWIPTWCLSFRNCAPIHRSCNSCPGTEELWLPAIVVEELELGVQLLPEGHRRNALRAWLNQLLADFSNRILSIIPPRGRVGRLLWCDCP